MICFSTQESMILLGSIERAELLALSDWWLSAERRILTQGEGVKNKGLYASWESIAFMDEEAEESDDEHVCEILTRLKTNKQIKKIRLILIEGQNGQCLL